MSRRPHNPLPHDHEQAIHDLVDARLKHQRHEADDHLDNGLLPQKLTPGTAGQVMWTNSTTGVAEWVDATTAAPPSGAAGGDLSGTYPNPQIAAGVIVNADVNAAAAIAYSKLNLSGSIVNADVAAGAAIVYSKLNLAASIVNADVAAGAAIAYSKLNLSGSIVNADIAAGAAIALSKLATDPLARANHTGTQTASTISDFTTAAQAVAVGGDLSGTVGSATIAISAARAAANGLVTGDMLDLALAEKVNVDDVLDYIRKSGTTFGASGVVLAADGAQSFTVNSTGGSPNSTTIAIKSDGSGAAELDFYTSGALQGSLSVAAGVHSYLDQGAARYLWSYSGSTLSLMPTSGTVTAPTPAWNDSSTSVATTQFVDRVASAIDYALSEKPDFDHHHKDEHPAFGQDGTVTIKTATNNPTLLLESTGASTYAVLGLKADGSGGAEIDFYNSGAVAGSLAVQAGVHSHVDATNSRYVWQYTAASNVLALMPTSGTVTAATQSAGDNSTKLATTAYADASLGKSTLADAKGDIFVATGDNTVTRLPVGSDGYVLTASSGAGSGVAWVTPGVPGAHASSHDVLGSDSLAPYYVSIDEHESALTEKADFDHNHLDVYTDACMYCASVYLANSGAPTHTSSGNWQKVSGGGGTDSWTSEYDIRPAGVGAQVTTTTDAAKITIQKAGVYMVTASVAFAAISDAKAVGAGVGKNGSTTPSIANFHTMGVGTEFDATVSAPMPLVVGDTLELLAWQNDSASEAYTMTLGAGQNRLTATYLHRSS